MISIILALCAWIGCGFFAGYLQNKYLEFGLSRIGLFFFIILGFCGLIVTIFEIIFNRDWWLEEAFKRKKNGL